MIAAVTATATTTTVSGATFVTIVVVMLFVWSPELGYDQLPGKILIRSEFQPGLVSDVLTDTSVVWSIILNTFLALKQYLVTKVGLSEAFLRSCVAILFTLLFGFIISSLIENFTFFITSFIRSWDGPTLASFS